MRRRSLEHRVQRARTFVLFLFICSLICSLTAQHLHKADTNTATDIANRVSGTLNEQITALVTLSKIHEDHIQESLIFLDRALLLAQKSGSDSLIYFVKKSYFDVYTEAGKMNQAYTAAIEMLHFGEQNNDWFRIGQANSSIASLFEKLDMADKAVAAQAKAVEAFGKSQNKKRYKEELYLSGYYYSLSGKHAQALNAFRKAFALNEKEQKPDFWFSAQTISRMSNSFAEMAMFDSAFIYRKKSIGNALQNKDNLLLAESYLYLGQLYERVNKNDSAVLFFETGLQLFSRARANPKMGLAAYYIVRNHFQQGKTDKALQMVDVFFKNENVFKKNKESYLKMLELAGKVYAASGNFKKSSDVLGRFIRLRDSLNEKDEKALVLEHNLANVFSEEKHKREIEDHKEQLRVEHDKKVQRYILLGIAFGFILSVLIMIISYRAYKKSVRDRKALSDQKVIIETKNREITESMMYAQRIQMALFASEENIKNSFKFLKGNDFNDSAFIFFRPKEIISGDFYWSAHKMTMENGSLMHRIFICCGDSTGHGIPGAFMSLLNISYLNEAVNEKTIYDPAQIFEYVRKKLTDSVFTENQQDGMDATIAEVCVVGRYAQSASDNLMETTIRYAAANNPPMVCSEEKITILPYDHAPVGYAERKLKFQTYEYTLTTGDALYLCTDGFQDQFGEKTGKKYTRKKLIRLIEAMSAGKMDQQSEHLNHEFVSWKGNEEQTDDVSIIGMRF